MTPSHVYVLSYLAGDRELYPGDTRVCYKILEQHYAELPERAREAFDDYREHRRLNVEGFVPKFHEARDRHDRGEKPKSTFDMAAFSLIRAGHRGTTSNEAKRRFDSDSGGIGGALNHLEQAGVAVRLKERR